MFPSLYRARLGAAALKLGHVRCTARNEYCIEYAKRDINTRVITLSAAVYTHRYRLISPIPSTC